MCCEEHFVFHQTISSQQMEMNFSRTLDHANLYLTSGATIVIVIVMTVMYDFGMLLLLCLMVTIFIILIILTNICVIIYQH